MRQDSDGMRGATLEYVRSMLGELRSMAEAERCELLAYLIEMAYIEATEINVAERRALGVREQQRDAAPGVPFEPPRKVKFQ